MNRNKLYNFFVNFKQNISVFINVILCLIIVVMPFIVVDTNNRKYVDGKAKFQETLD